MHYKNGQKAQNGDTVMYRRCCGEVAAGMIFNINSDPACKTCNGMVSRVIPGGCSAESVTVGEVYPVPAAFEGTERYFEKLAADAAAALTQASAAPLQVDSTVAPVTAAPAESAVAVPVETEEATLAVSAEAAPAAPAVVAEPAPEAVPAAA